MIRTLRKLKTVPPSLKSSIPKMLRSGVGMSARQADDYKVAYQEPGPHDTNNILRTVILPSEDDVDMLRQTAKGGETTCGHWKPYTSRSLNHIISL